MCPKYEDEDYQRYYALFGEREVISDRFELTPEQMLADDEISAAEEGFLKGYADRGYRDVEWL